MYTSNPLEGNAYGGVPPAKPTPEWKELQTARQRVGLMLVAHAKAQPQALLPHLTRYRRCGPVGQLAPMSRALCLM